MRPSPTNKLKNGKTNVIRNIDGEGKGSYGHVVQELKARAIDFQKISFVHERRSANGDAHLLARGSVSLELGRHVWFLNPPDGVCKNYDVI